MDVNENPEPNFKYTDIPDVEMDEMMESGEVLEEMGLCVGSYFRFKDGSEQFKVIHIFEYGEVRLESMDFKCESDISLAELYTCWRQGDVVPLSISFTPK